MIFVSLANDRIERPLVVADHQDGSLVRWGWFVIIQVVASVLLALPTFFIVGSVTQFGAVRGWWSGDPTANDGEESWAAPIGLIGWVLVALFAILASQTAARPLGAKRAAVRCLGSLLLGQVFLIVVFMPGWIGIG